MEIIPEGKNFRLVQDHELPELMKTLEQYMPESLKFHQTIQTYLNNRVWQFYFYVSKNWPEEPVCLHFPGCTLTVNNSIYGSFGVFCPSSHIECVDLLDTEDVLIDWHEPMYLNFTHIAIMERLDAFYERNYGVMERLYGDIYVSEGLPDDLELDSLPSDEVQMRPLTRDNVQAIHDLYPASEIECVSVFEKLVETLPGFGIFTMSGELAAWMMQSYYGAMFSMQTKEQYRRKGYGIHLAQALTQKVFDRGYKPFVVIRPHNDASRNLYTKLGYSRAFETCRVTLNPTKLGLPKDKQIVLQPHLLLAAELAASVASATDEGIEDGRNEDTVSLKRHEGAVEQQRMNGNDDDKDEGIDDDGETPNDEERQNGEGEGGGGGADGVNGD